MVHPKYGPHPAEVLEILTRAWDVIEDPKHWALKWYAVDAAGESIGTGNIDAVAWCSLGATHKVTNWANEDEGDYSRRALKEAARLLYALPVGHLNDSGTHQDVQRMYAFAVADVYEEVQRRNSYHAFEVLASAWDVIADPLHWAKGYYAYMEDGTACYGDSRYAKSWCALGAMQHVQDSFSYDATATANATLDEAADLLYEVPAANVNDTLEHLDVERCYALAVAMLEETYSAGVVNDALVDSDVRRHYDSVVAWLAKARQDG